MDTSLVDSGQFWPWLIPALPLLGALLAGGLHFDVLRRRKNDSDASGAPVAAGIAILAMAGAFLFSLKGFLALRAGDGIILSTAFDWIPTGDFTVRWSLMIDQLSSLMTLVVTGVGLLIHIYAAGYMKGDEGYAKFFAYLNLFVAMMLIPLTYSITRGVVFGFLTFVAVKVGVGKIRADAVYQYKLGYSLPGGS